MAIATSTIRQTPPRLVARRWAALVAALSMIAYLISRLITHPSSIDLIVYRDEGRAMLDGANLYGALPVGHHLLATYPPAAALFFTVVATIPLAAAEAIVCLANLALVLLVSALSCSLVGVARERRALATLALSAVGVWAEPVFTTLRYGQINLVLLALVLADFTAWRGRPWRGVGIGLAAAIKVTPGIFIVYLLLTRRFRAAAVATGTFLATVAVAAAVVPRESWRFWTKLLYDPSRVGRVENEANQSMRGWLAKLEHTRAATTPGTAIIAALLVVGLAIAVLAYRRLGDGWGLPAAAVTGLLISPITWTHHWVWCVPMALVLWQWRRAAVLVVAVFWSFAVWFLPHTAPAEFRYAVWQQALAAQYVVAGLVFLALTVAAARARSRSRPRPS